ncbi:TPA: DUF1738 domain-containing protein [Stenotrophomonas maltophilia]|nr:DUF1738 domain-containing protein [Stenotrophomonas maltophilia]HDS1659466.1 DUF1738 domain-containing protein [Stenotrophomonas maltophilia]HDS1673349.1 DUF1738 domain-containing protein [Stenotrophomonas maltophilia]
MDRHEYQRLQAKNFYDNLREGVAPPLFRWQDPDTPLPQIGGEPRGVSGYCFEADNALQLAMAAKAQGFQSPYWLSTEQANAAGGYIRKGEVGTKILKWIRKDGQLSERVPATVFNADQIKGLNLPRQKGLTPEQQATRQAGLDALIAPRKKTPTIEQYNARLKEVMAEKFPAQEDVQDNARMALRREYAIMTGQARLGLPREVEPELARELKPFIEHRPHPQEVVRALDDAYAALKEVGVEPLVYASVPRKEMAQQPVKPASEPRPKRERSQAKAKEKGREQSNDIPF